MQPRVRAQPPPKPPPKVDELAGARAALTEAFAAHTQAQRDHRDANRALARLQPPNFAGKQISWLEMSDAAFAAYSAAERKVSQTKGALSLAELDVKSAEESLDLAFEIAEMKKKAVAERAARQQERQAAAAEASHRRERREKQKEDLNAWKAGRRWYLLLRHLHAHAALDEIEAAEARDETRARLEADAVKVWGAAAQQNKENAVNVAQRKVFRLVGKSAAEVRALASEVSQITTGIEERVALNRL